MREPGLPDAGFSLVEVVIAMLVLGLIAITMIPVLWQGIALSSEGSTKATATRYVNALIEDARQAPSCDTFTAVLARTDLVDARDNPLTVNGSFQREVPDVDPSNDCDEPGLWRIELTVAAVDGASASASALIYVK